MSRWPLAASAVLLGAGWLVAVSGSVRAEAPQIPPTSPVSSTASTSQASPHRQLLDTYCVTCHNARLRVADLTLDTADVSNPALDADVWERVVSKIRAGAMPPVGMPRPEPATSRALVDWLEREIDRTWVASPTTGPSTAVHRLNRTEYNNAIRDLFALDLDVKPLLPGDDTADGSFDNFADAQVISTTHLERYLSVARQVTRLAIGLPPAAPRVDTFEIPLHIVQDDRLSDDLPFGSRGGLAVRHIFPVDGEYLIKVRLRRQYQDYIMGMGWPQQLDVRADGRLLKRFTVGGGAPGRPAGASFAGDGEPGFGGDPEWETYMQLTGDAGLEIRLSMDAGSHLIGVSFVREMFEPAGLPQPLQRGRVLTNDEIYMGHASVGSLEIAGPYRIDGTATDTPSRRAIFVCEPQSERDERACAETILSRMARLAYRRPSTEADVTVLLDFFDAGRRDGDSFDAGIQFALERMLADPDFLLRVHRTPVRLSDIELASRLSFFLWSSIPDEPLLDLAERGQLADSRTRDEQVRRMLGDPRAVETLVGDFAAQWLNLRLLGDVVVHPDLFPDFDDNLLDAFRQEAELFLASTLREDRSVLDLIRADYTFVNERLARHYGIPGIYGSRFRRVPLPGLDERVGLLGKGAILTTTSYPDRTSPVVRGKWLLNNIFGLPTPAPPPGVDTNLPEPEPGSAPPTIRERLAQHRSNPVCSSCHAAIDPLGFALENYDAIGGWRTTDASGRPVDATGVTLGGQTIDGPAGLRDLLLEEPSQFPRTVTEKLFAYALGRPLDYRDRPAIRQIVRDAAVSDYRWSSIIAGIANSPAFLMRAPTVAVN